MANYDNQFFQSSMSNLQGSDGDFIKGDSPQSKIIPKTITENGTYNASSDNADGYSKVTVDVAGGGETFEVDFSSLDFVEWTANKSYAETLSAIENGDNVRFKFVNSGETKDSTGYYLFVEENSPENDKIIMITMSSAYISNRMATMFLKWTINDEIAMIQLEEQS